jgi:hypothetical protein
MATLSKASVCSSSLSGTTGLNSAGDIEVVNVVCCQVQVSSAGRSVTQRSPTACGVPSCNQETSRMMMPRPLSQKGNYYT